VVEEEVGDDACSCAAADRKPIMRTFDEHPVVLWELTRACDLQCRNCTIGATGNPGTNELTTYEAYKTIDQIATLAPRELVITGGDPLEREDLAQIINYARRRGLDPALVLVPASHLTHDSIASLERNGLSRIVLSIDGSSSDIHQAGRGVLGTFASTLHTASLAKNAKLAIEINTLVTPRNMDDLPAIAQLIRSMEIVRWNLYFQVPMASSHTEMMSAMDAERVFGVIDAIQERETFAVRVIEAPHYRRYRLQRALSAGLEDATDAAWSDFSGYEQAGNPTQRDLIDCARDGVAGFLFISHSGDVRASEFLLFSAGNIRYRSLATIYRASDFFVALRDPRNLTGKCGCCEYRELCGGSRARAWATEWNVFAEDPLCSYNPPHTLPLPAGPSRRADA
jgi:radical SAM protein with 4Fe4S-binding SPASM domain